MLVQAMPFPAEIGLTPSAITGFVSDGDSITAGSDVYPHYPDLLMASTGLAVENIGVAGRQLQTMDSEYATATAPFYDATRMNTIILLGGVNDIRSHGADDSDLQTWVQSYCGKAIATGFNVYVGTIMPCSSSWNATKEGYRTAYNSWLLANYASFCHGVIDFAGNASLSDSTDTTYYEDGLHPSHRGFEVMREEIVSSLSLTEISRSNATTLFPAEQTIASASLVNIPMSGQLVDDLDLWDRASPEVITIPASINGRYGRFVGNERSNTGNQIVGTFTKNGSTFVGSQASADAESAAASAVNCKTPPILLATGDEFRLRTYGGSTGSWTLPNDQLNFFGFELLPSDFDGCLVTRTSTQSISASTPTMILWNAEEYDLNGWHSTASNTSRLTVPSGVTRVRVSAGIAQPSSTAILTVEIYKNGAKFRGMAAANTNTLGGDGINVTTGVVEVTAGDYFEVRATSTSAQTLAANTQWASIEEVPSDRSAVLMHPTSSQSISASSSTEIEFTTAVYDDDSWYDSGSPNAVTVPSGINRVRMTTNVIGGNTNFGAFFLKNGRSVYGGGNHDTDGGTEAVNVMSAIIPVAPGDELSVAAFDSGGMTITTDEGNWFCVEAMD